MQLDHASLESFEPIIKELYNCAFGRALTGLAAAGVKPGEEWHTEAGRMFQAVCFPGFKNTQAEAGSKIIALERQIRSLTAQGILERKRRNTPAVNRLEELQRVLKNRQLVLRRLMDGILWVLLWPERWLLRRLRVEGGIRQIDPDSLTELLRVITDDDADDENRFSLISDLTTVVQLGDLVLATWNPRSNGVKIVLGEIKVGRVNKLLHTLIHNPDLGEMDSSLSKIARELAGNSGNVADKKRELRCQIRRMARQEQRLANFVQVATTDKGVNPMSGQRFSMSKTVVSKDYRDEIRTRLNRAKLEGSAGLTLDGCLHLFAGVTKDGPDLARRNGLLVAHIFREMRHNYSWKTGQPQCFQDDAVAELESAPMAVNLLDFSMRSPLGLPPILWYPRDLMLDVLMGRIKVFAQFDHERFFELAAQVGLRMRFIRGKESARIKQNKLSAPLPEYRDNRYVRIENAKGQVSFSGARFFSNVYINLIRPCDLIRMAKALVQECPGSSVVHPDKG